jgi:hypothetical protein
MPTSKIPLVIQIVLTVILAAPGHCQTSSGSISGNVVGSDKTPLQAVITVRAIGPVKTNFLVTSAVNGTFTVTSLAPGEYQVCARPNNGAYINSCLWYSNPPIKVTAGKATTGYRLVLKKAATLQVNLNDPSALLGPSTSGIGTSGGAVGAQVVFGVITDSKIFVGLPVVSRSATGRVHALAVPADEPVSLHILSHGLVVANTNAPGTDVGGSTLPVTISSTQANSPVVFTVQGTKP